MRTPGDVNISILSLSHKFSPFLKTNLNSPKDSNTLHLDKISEVTEVEDTVVKVDTRITTIMVITTKGDIEAATVIITIMVDTIITMEETTEILVATVPTPREEALPTTRQSNASTLNKVSNVNLN